MRVIDEPTPSVPPYAAPEPPETRYRRLQKWLWNKRPETRVGTLHYTGFGLIMMFVWLLWGDFCLQLLDTNIPEILPLKLKELGAGDTTNAVLNKTFAYAVAFLLAPMVSFRSDRLRTRWGRRIPYLLWSTPFVGLFLILIGYYDALTNLLAGGAAQATFLGFTVSRQTLSLIVIGALIVGWDFANIFVNTVYYYLFNDVVPSKYLARFLALFRIVYSIAGIAYNTWVLPHSMTHFRIIFVLAGVGYVVGFMLMCLFVREGSYPPPPPNVDGGHGFISAMKTYAKECFTHRLYWFFFIANACTFTSRLCSMFVIIRNTKSLGLSLDEIGVLNRWVIGIALLLQYPAGWLCDRFHPLRVYLLARAWFTVGTLATCVWIFHDFGVRGNLVFLYITALASMPLNLIADAAELPMYMRLLPKDRYGQFCSANGMVRAFAMIFGSVLAGVFIGSMEPWFGERRYTWVSGWQLVFQILAVLFLILLYRQWKLHGGDKSYIPPGVQVTTQNELNLTPA